ncbi:MAG: Smr/MutS family protein [Bacteroidaceae bacterium]|nr:Smr/MutS family protein [Bacteroidaceae bacterium]
MNNDIQQTTKQSTPLPREGNGGGAAIEKKIGFDEIRTLLKGHCISKLGTERVEALSFQTDAEQIQFQLNVVDEIRQILDTELQLPGEDFFDLRLPVRRLRVEGVYMEENDLWELKRALDTLHSWIEVIRAEDSPYKALDKLSEGVFTFNGVTRQIENILDKYGHVKDTASPELMRIRRELHRTEGSVSRTLNSILESAKKEGLIENSVMPAIRDGRLVIPVAPALKRRIRGIVHGESATGKTIFIEPAAVVEANNNLRELEAEEKREIIRILQTFADTLRPNVPELLRAFEFLADVELALAKYRLGQQIGGITPQLKNYPLIDWTQARHPLLELKLRRHQKKVVPLDVELTPKDRILIISGPNAGGKSVCLKTVGLLQYMLQCALPIPVGENSRVGLFSAIFIDIGDEQSIADDLSTYSSHLLNMKQMMKECSDSSLLLIDEFGGGTEPTIGGALAEAMLRQFVERRTYAVITTHYQNLKHFADNHEGVVNGSMLYDRQQMQALFQLEIGHPGSSFAIEIARKIGIPEQVITDASEIVGQDYVNADRYLLDIVRDKRYWEGKRQTIHQREKDMEKTLARYEEEIAELQHKRKEIIASARQQATELLNQSNAMVENTIREIRESQAEKERTREVRQELDTFRTALSEEDLEKDAAIERKMQQILARKQRQEQRKRERSEKNSGNQTAAEQQPKPTPQKQWTEGSPVRIKGQSTTGTLETIKGKKCTVLFGSIRTTLPLDMLEPADGPIKQQPAVTATTYISRQTLDQMHKTQLNFRPEIDVRGQRGDEALQTITRFIDDAILVGAPRVRILHGTGNGILRQLIRQYLGTVPQVSNARDEHIQFGGAGITVVEFA